MSIDRIDDRWGSENLVSSSRSRARALSNRLLPYLRVSLWRITPKIPEIFSDFFESTLHRSLTDDDQNRAVMLIACPRDKFEMPVADVLMSRLGDMSHLFPCLNILLAVVAKLRSGSLRLDECWVMVRGVSLVSVLIVVRKKLRVVPTSRLSIGARWPLARGSVVIWLCW